MDQVTHVVKQEVQNKASWKHRSALSSNYSVAAEAEIKDLQYFIYMYDIYVKVLIKSTEDLQIFPGLYHLHIPFRQHQRAEGCLDGTQTKPSKLEHLKKYLTEREIWSQH